MPQACIESEKLSKITPLRNWLLGEPLDERVRSLILIFHKMEPLS
jgi:hypothetical protein